jgi:hypothetical protein
MIIRKIVCGFGLFLYYLFIGTSVAQERLQTSLLCDLQLKMKAGEHQSIRVEGIFLAGMNASQYLVAPECSIRSTYIEFDLRIHKNWKKLRKIINVSNREKQVIGDSDPVFVVFEGEFYGPPEPDPKLPERIRKIYHAGWDSNAMTKLIVHAINSVKPLPENHPCAPSENKKWPCFQRNAIPKN